MSYFNFIQYYVILYFGYTDTLKIGRLNNSGFSSVEDAVVAAIAQRDADWNVICGPTKIEIHKYSGWGKKIEAVASTPV